MGRRTFEEEKHMSLVPDGSTAPLPVICERLRYYRRLRKTEQKQLAKELGITGNAISNWEKGRSRPDVSLIPELCRVLDISLYDLFGVEYPERLDAGEAEHLEAYRKLKNGNRILIDGLMGNMLRMQEAEEVPRLIRLQYFEKPLAAGIGDPTELEGFCDIIYLYESEQFRRADYVFRISGDSMEPDYRNGDLVLVERMSSGLTLREGEVGAFIVGNEMYIKEYRRDGLHSLNPAYDMLRFDEEQAVYLIGKVLSVLNPAMVANASDVEKFQLVYE